MARDATETESGARPGSQRNLDTGCLHPDNYNIPRMVSGFTVAGPSLPLLMQHIYVMLTPATTPEEPDSVSVYRSNEGLFPRCNPGRSHQLPTSDREERPRQLLSCEGTPHVTLDNKKTIRMKNRSYVY